MTATSFRERFPPPDRPWTQEYVDLHRQLVAEALDDPALIETFRRGDQLPPGFGVGFDERVVEYPWLLSQGLGGRMLDAGSALNHEHVIDRVVSTVDELHIVTLEPEERAFTQSRVSYVYSDLRSLPYRDGYFDLVVCLSTLEHVGMDNERYGVIEPRAEDPASEMRRAIGELVRVCSRRLLISVPYGQRADHGWFRQFDRADVEAMVDAVSGEASTTVFRYYAEGWQISDLTSAAAVKYRDFTADSSPVDDLAAAARAVVCVSVGIGS